MTFLPDLHIFVAYTAAALLLILTPGPDMTLFLGQTLTGGRSRGAAAMLGASTGLIVHTMLAAFGLSALLTASATAFGLVKIAGVAAAREQSVQSARADRSLTANAPIRLANR